MNDYSMGFWAVHSSKEQRPVFRGWGRSKEEAQKRLEEIRIQDSQREDEYWLAQMTDSDVMVYQCMGIIPANT